MSWLQRFLFPHAVSIQAARRGGGMGGGFAQAVDVAAEVKDGSQLVRTPDGVEIVSTSQVTVSLGTVAPIGSLVTVWAGTPAERESTVVQVGRDENDPPLPSHQILYLK